LGKKGTCPKCKNKIAITDKNTWPIDNGEGPPPAAGDAGAALPSAPKKRRIGEMLVEAELVTDAQVQEALAVQKERGGKIVEILVSLGHIDVKQFVDFLAKQPGIASITLANYEVPGELRNIIPKKFALDNDVFPIDRMKNLLTVAMACPIDGRTVEDLERITGLRVKPVLCSMQEIRALINKYYGEDEAKKPPVEAAADVSHIEGALKLENVAALIRQIDSLPALPDTVRQFQEIMNSPDITLNDVVGIVQSDPPVAAKVLAIANSSAYGFPNRVHSLELAVLLLGLQEVYTLVLSFKVLDSYQQLDQLDYARIWKNAIRCADNALIVAKVCGRSRISGLFAAALLHDIGRITLSEIIPQRYGKIPASLTGRDLLDTEQEELGITHAEAGYLLASNWALPAEITEPIRFHHGFQYAKQSKDIVAIVTVAAVMTQLTDNGKALDKDAMVRSCGEAIDFLGLDLDLLAPPDEDEAPFELLASPIPSGLDGFDDADAV
ncbi:MAG: hypothetical protein QG656_749, partial [Candidatus Hydrogenedentes bacterium]|nr:hypothetical protein [Candidatus Hydrogenedentota bacterium]